MRAAVRATFVGFTTPLEGCVPYLYADVKNLITVGIGNLAEPIEVALAMPFVHGDGQRATRQEIAAAWLAVKHDPQSAKLGHLYARRIVGNEDIALTDDGIDQIVAGRLSQMDIHLTHRFPTYETWPSDAQLATLSMAWSCGPAFHFPALEAALRATNFTEAAAACTINETGNPGVRPRNVANRRLYMNAAYSLATGLDPDVLHYPASLTGEADTGSGGIVHPPVYGWSDDPDDVA